MSVSKAVLTLAIPTVISQLITVVYNMADTFFIGQLNDPKQVVASERVYFRFSVQARKHGATANSMCSGPSVWAHCRL